MNTARNTIVLAAASLLMAACASMPETASKPESLMSDDTVDIAYVEAVNRAAKSAGVKVVWLRPPRQGDRRD